MSETATSTPADRVDAPPTELGRPDFTYLHLDGKNNPAHWSMVLELDTEGEHLTLDEVRVRVRERGALFDIFRLGVRNGRWRAPEIVIADEIDADKQVTAASFTDAADLHRQIAELMQAPLSRPDPFWHITLFTPAESGAQTILLRVHHALSDGIAGAAFAALLADGTDEELAEFERFATSPRHRIDPIDPEVLKESKAAFEEQWRVKGKAGGWPKLTRTGRRETAVHSVSTRTLRKIAKHHGASVHEFLLAAIGRSLSIAPPPGKSQAELLRVTLPVTNDPGFRHTGNAVLVSLLNMPGNETDLGVQIERCRAELAVVERRHPELATASAEGAPLGPWPVVRFLTNAATARMAPDIHVGINPGFSRIRSVLGRKITELTPLSPLIGYSFSVTALILGTKTSLGIVTDPAALPPGYTRTFIETFDRVLAEATPSE